MIALSVAALALVGAACGSDNGGGSGGSDGAAADTKPVTLRFSYFSGEKTSYGKLWSWWMDEVTKRTGGKVKFERFWDGSLLGAPETVQGLKDGRVDITQVTPVYYPGSFPLSAAAELPFVTQNVPAVSAAYASLENDNKALQDEWGNQGMQPLAWNAAPGSALGTTFAINGVSDLRGKKLRALDRGSKVLGSVGANLLNVQLSELYGAMQRGLVDGYYGIPFDFIGPLKLTEVTDYITDPGIGVAAMSSLAMSKKGWNDLPESVQSVMTEVSKDVPTKQAEFEATTEDESCAAVKQADIKMSVLPPDQVDKLRPEAEKVKQAWLDEASSKGAPAQEFLDQYMQTLDKQEQEFSDFQTGLQRCIDGGS